jgi:hypothetical protein
MTKAFIVICAVLLSCDFTLAQATDEDTPRFATGLKRRK